MAGASKAAPDPAGSREDLLIECKGIIDFLAYTDFRDNRLGDKARYLGLSERMDAYLTNFGASHSNSGVKAENLNQCVNLGADQRHAKTGDKSDGQRTVTVQSSDSGGSVPPVAQPFMRTVLGGKEVLLDDKLQPIRPAPSTPGEEEGKEWNCIYRTALAEFTEKNPFPEDTSYQTDQNWFRARNDFAIQAIASRIRREAQKQIEAYRRLLSQKEGFIIDDHDEIQHLTTLANENAALAVERETRIKELEALAEFHAQRHADAVNRQVQIGDVYEGLIGEENEKTILEKRMEVKEAEITRLKGLLGEAEKALKLASDISVNSQFISAGDRWMHKCEFDKILAKLTPPITEKQKD